MKKVRGKGFIHGFDWGLYPETERFLQRHIRTFIKNHKRTARLAKQLQDKTSTHLIDWIDHMVLPRVDPKKMKQYGFQKEDDVYRHPNGIFFTIVHGDHYELVLKPENIEFFKKTWKVKNKIQGKRYNAVRYLEVKKEKTFILSAMERRGSTDMTVPKSTDITLYKDALQTFKKRKRLFPNDARGMAATLKLVRKVMKKLSPQRTADAFFRVERMYWEKRNTAGKVQRKRQDLLGLGWGNHDHHTFRSSREHFQTMVKIFEEMGYLCRERFYAGERAGWGAQVMEHPECDIVVFADVDVTRKEKDTDFAHRKLKHRKKLGTVGTWVGLHGESILQAGMHHLEARFDFKRLCKDLPKHDIKVMNPFSDFPFLKQAFTVGEKWKVDPKRAKKLHQDGSITDVQYQRFLKEGAIGSHLENLERRQGYKGFNQDSVTAILKLVDPRKERHA